MSVNKNIESKSRIIIVHMEGTLEGKRTLIKMIKKFLDDKNIVNKVLE